MSSGFNDRPLAPFAGILSLGIGDTMVSQLVAMYYYVDSIHALIFLTIKFIKYVSRSNIFTRKLA